MSKYIHIGCFSDINAVKRGNKLPNEIIADIDSDDFEHVSPKDICIVDESDLSNKVIYHCGKYIIHYDVADYLLNKPLDEIKDVAFDEYIDIYEVIDGLFEIKNKTYVTDDGMVFGDKKCALNHKREIERIKNNRKNLITTKRGISIGYDDIMDFFNKCNCQNCPFAEECNNMYNKIRCSTTDTFTLCDVVKHRLD